MHLTRSGTKKGPGSPSKKTHDHILGSKTDEKNNESMLLTPTSISMKNAFIIKNAD